MELQMESPSFRGFEFNSGRASPCGSSPSTPKGFGDYYFSAPTSPARAFGIYREAEHLSAVGIYERGDASISSIPFDFPFATNIESKSPVQPPLASGGSKVETVNSPLLSPHQSPYPSKRRHKKSFWSTLSPKRKKESDNCGTAEGSSKDKRVQGQGKERARGRVLALTDYVNGRRAIRSLSPPRESKFSWEEEDPKLAQNAKEITSTSKPTSSELTLSSSSKGNRKWRLKDWLLFRSASEGRAFDKDPLKKYSYQHRKHEVAKSQGTPSTQGSAHESGIPIRKGQVSAHEMHYTVNKAISQDMKKKSFLPYKQGILGRLAINPAVHALAHGFGL